MAPPDAPSVRVFIDCGPGETEVPRATEARTDPARMAKLLTATHKELIAMFRCAFAAHQFNVTGYSDAQISRAVCAEPAAMGSITDRERLQRAFSRLQSRRRTTTEP